MTSHALTPEQTEALKKASADIARGVRRDDFVAFAAVLPRLAQDLLEPISEYLDAGRLYRLDGSEVETTLVERAKWMEQALAAESDGHREARRELAEAKARLEPVEKERDEAKARVREVEVSCIAHFQRDHLEGDGPEIDRWRWKGRADDFSLSEAREENTRLREQLDEARETNTRLQRRCQSAEAGLTAKLGGGSMLGRALANSAATMYRDQLQEAQSEIARLHRAGQLVDDTALEPRPPLRDDRTEG